MVRVIARKGYRAASVADVIAEAGTSPSVFSTHFTGKSDCFLAAHDMVFDRVLVEVARSCDGRRPWTARARFGLTALVRAFALDPALGRTAIVEVGVAGRSAWHRHWDAIQKFTHLLEEGRDPGDAGELPQNIPLMASGAVFGLISDQLQAGRPDRLPELLPNLVFALLVPYVGPRAAASEMQQATAAD